MKDNPISIVQDYVGSQNPQIRKNALTALAVIDTEESVGKLVELGLTDSDYEVRLRAVKELLRTDRSYDSHISKLLGGALIDDTTKVAAGWMLGLLRDESRDVLPRRQSLRARLKIAWPLVSYVYPRRDYPFRLRGVKPGAVTGIAGGALLFAFLYFFLGTTRLHSPSTETFILSFLVSACVATFLAGIAVQRAVPLKARYDLTSGVLVELTGGMLWGVLPGGFFLILAFIANDLAITILAALIPYLFLAVRCGVWLVSEVVHDALLNRVFQVVVGASAGIVLLTLGCWALYAIAFRVTPGWFDLASRTHYLSLTWLTLLPSSCGIAHAYASVDRERRSNSVSWRLASRVVGIVIVATLLVPMVTVVASNATLTNSAELGVVKRDGRREFRKTIEAIPFYATLSVRSKTNIGAVLQSLGSNFEIDRPEDDYVLILERKSEQMRYKTIAHADDPEYINWAVDPGEYRFVVDYYRGRETIFRDFGPALDSGALGTVFPSLLDEILGTSYVNELFRRHQRQIRQYQGQMEGDPIPEAPADAESAAEAGSMNDYGSALVSHQIGEAAQNSRRDVSQDSSRPNVEPAQPLYTTESPGPFEEPEPNLLDSSPVLENLQLLVVVNGSVTLPEWDIPSAPGDDIPPAPLVDPSAAMGKNTENKSVLAWDRGRRQLFLPFNDS